MPETVKLLWLRLIHYGSHHYSDKRDARFNVVGNLLLLVFAQTCLLVLIMMGGIILVYYSNQTYRPYQGYGQIFAAFPILIFLMCAGTYLLKNKFGHNYDFVVLALVLAGGIMFSFCYTIGINSGFYLFVVELTILPFFVFPKTKKNHLILVELILIALLVGLVLLYIDHKPPYPIPPELDYLAWVMVMALQVQSLLLAGYYSWNATNNMEERLVVINEDLQEKSYILNEEMQLAARIQEGVLEEELHKLEELKFASSYEPLHNVSGDFYAVYKNNESIYVLMADVSGHGVPAALITMLASQIFSRQARLGGTPAEVLKAANQQLYQHLKTPYFLTAFLINISPDYHISYCNGGHPPVMHYKAADKSMNLLDTKGTILGPFETHEVGHHFVDQETILEPGDRLFMYTDGFLEQINSSIEPFGSDRLETLVSKNQHLSLDEIHELILKSLRKFRGDYPQKDDLSLFSVERKS